MDLVIRISDDIKKYIDTAMIVILTQQQLNSIIHAIKNGIKLPEHYGKLIDAESAQKYIMNDLRLGDDDNGLEVDELWRRDGLYQCYDYINNADPIIPPSDSHGKDSNTYVEELDVGFLKYIDE